METAYIFAISTGFMGGFGHCMGMCGPIAASLSLRDPQTRRFRQLAGHLLYNAGRIMTYAFVSAAAGLTGSLVGSLPSFSKIVLAIAGGFMIFGGLGITGITGGLSKLETHNSGLIRVARNLSVTSPFWGYFLAGAIFGFLPCGLSYSIFAAAAATGSISRGLITGLLFGIGTAPALIAFGLAASLIGTTIRGIIYRAAGVIVTVMGILYVLKAFGIHAKV